MRVSRRPVSLRFCVLGLLLAFLPLAQLQAAPPEEAPPAPLWEPPQWSEGMSWGVAVRTEVRRAEEGEDGEVHYTRSVGRPRLWNFVVAASEEIEGFPALRFRVLAQPQVGEDPPVEMDFVARLHEGRVAALAMEALRYGSPEGRNERDFRKEFHEPAPVLYQGAPIPVAFPMILRGQTGKRSFEKTRMIGVLPFADDVLQEVRGGEAALARAEELGLQLRGQEVWNLKVERPLDRELMEQIWVGGQPWPAWTRAGPLEATLVP